MHTKASPSRVTRSSIFQLFRIFMALPHCVRDAKCRSRYPLYATSRTCGACRTLKQGTRVVRSYDQPKKESSCLFSQAPAIIVRMTQSGFFSVHRPPIPGTTGASRLWAKRNVAGGDCRVAEYLPRTASCGGYGPQGTSSKNFAMFSVKNFLN